MQEKGLVGGAEPVAPPAEDESESEAPAAEESEPAAEEAESEAPAAEESETEGDK